MAELLNKVAIPIISKLGQFLPIPTKGASLSPEDSMRLAISEARKGIGFTSPNPLVGCVIVDREHRFVASGYHHQSGFAHAEIDALSQVSDPALLEGATVYVTLEPCAHEGRTGSCAKALAKLPLKSVVYGLKDPFPLVNGQGEAILREAGITSYCFGQLTQELEELAEIFLWNVREKQPFFAMKVASSLDGRMALSNGESKWITGPEAREYSHYLRAHYDAVLIGRNTFVSDDPALNIRLKDFPRSQNKVILLDPSAQTLAALPQSQLWQVREKSLIFVVIDEAHLSKAQAALQQDLAAQGVQFLSVAFNSKDGFNIPDLQSKLWGAGLRSVFVEGGAQTFASFFKAQALQRLHLFLAPQLLGAEHGISWSQGLSVTSMSQRLNLQSLQPKVFGPDLYFTSRLRWSI
jgi:diaminohydroxyphosphoribosylaminopyrimidine deaminase/5-amino-6-(5-phosphoribosylamino)uracil reductase